MLSFDDARDIVHGSVREVASETSFSADNTLSDLGISLPQFDNLISTIQSRTESKWSRIDSEKLGLAAHITISALTIALQLSGRKLCSNDMTPHEQPCCPYPTTCGECGKPVL
jgi:hypothetical protein